MLHQLAPKYFDTGKAKLIYHHMAFLGQESQWAAEASDCANDQGKFWEYADYLLTHQAGENAGAFNKQNLKGFAQKLGLETTSFNACFDSGKYTQQVQQETAQGSQRGVIATPTFFIGGQKYEGLPTIDNFESIIDSLSK